MAYDIPPRGGANGEAHCDEEGVLHGWCWHPDEPSARQTVELLLNGTVIRTVVASRFREDLRERKIGDGYHGFTVVLPSVNRANTGTAHIAARIAGTQTVFWQTNALKFRLDEASEAHMAKMGKALRELAVALGGAAPQSQAAAMALALKMLAGNLQAVNMRKTAGGRLAAGGQSALVARAASSP